MRNYNIYVNEVYMYTSLCESSQEATDIAFKEAVTQFEESPKAKEIISQILDDVFDTVGYNSTALQLALDYFNEEMAQRIEYGFVLTDEDTIPANDLIFDYIIDGIDYNPSQVSSPGD